MALLLELRHRARSMAGPLIIACIVSYFGFHAVQGDRGILFALLSANRVCARQCRGNLRSDLVRLRAVVANV